jgi:hypothetical protein
MTYLNFKHCKYIIVVGVFMIINGCDYIKNGKRLIKLSQTPIKIEYPLKRYDLENKWTDYERNNKYKVINYIDATCSTCIETLIDWKRFMQKHRDWEIDYYFYIKPTDIEFLAEFLKDIEFNYPIIIDEGNQFLKNNNRPIEENLSAKIIWLINAENKIIISGDPINNSRILKAYESVFQK